jgi:hypothetical protein
MKTGDEIRDAQREDDQLHLGVGFGFARRGAEV